MNGEIDMKSQEIRTLTEKLTQQFINGVNNPNVNSDFKTWVEHPEKSKQEKSDMIVNYVLSYLPKDLSDEQLYIAFCVHRYIRTTQDIVLLDNDEVMWYYSKN